MKSSKDTFMNFKKYRFMLSIR